MLNAVIRAWFYSERKAAAAAAAAAAAESLQSCLTLCNPIDGSLQGSAVPGIFQARILEWVAIAFSEIKRYTRAILTKSCMVNFG